MEDVKFSPPPKSFYLASKGDASDSLKNLLGKLGIKSAVSPLVIRVATTGIYEIVAQTSGRTETNVQHLNAGAIIKCTGMKLTVKEL